MGIIDDNLKKINNRIASICSEFGRNRDVITLVGISKTMGPEAIMEAWLAGLKNFGENRIQEASKKIHQVEKGPTWHMVGHLQTNKVKKAVDLFDIIESVDSLRLAETISGECEKKGKEIKVLLEVNSSGETTKYGLEPDEVLLIAEQINRLDNLKLSGLMTVGPFTDDLEQIDKSFALTQKLFGKMQDKFGVQIKTLSMGMSADFERAIKFGSTELRIGTAIFGKRNNQ